MRSVPPLLFLFFVGIACSDAAWQAGAVGDMDLLAEVPAVPDERAFVADLSGDRVDWPEHLRGVDVIRADGELAAQTGAPRVFYLHYAGYGAAPAASVCAGRSPPKYECIFGGTDGVPGCQKKVQYFLDKWYADFNLVFTLTKPTSGMYYSEVITASGTWCGQADTVGGIAPFSCTDMRGGTCYAFLCRSSAKVCAVIISQEQAHLVGLEHTDSAKDLLYPAVCSSCDGFEDKDNGVVMGRCRSTQNSYQMMKDRLGVWPADAGPKPGPFACMDGAPPAVSIVAPMEGATVPAAFTVEAAATDDCGVAEATIEVGGSMSTAMGAGPYRWDLADISGDVTIKVTAKDKAGNTGSASVAVHGPGARGDDGGGARDGGGAGRDAAGGGEEDGDSAGLGCRLAAPRPSGRIIALLAAGAAIVGLRRRRR